MGTGRLGYTEGGDSTCHGMIGVYRAEGTVGNILSSVFQTYSLHLYELYRAHGTLDTTEHTRYSTVITARSLGYTLACIHKRNFSLNGGCKSALIIHMITMVGLTLVSENDMSLSITSTMRSYVI